MFSATGKGAAALFRPEAGGHRWQREPPTERRGRVHTSTVTVAVLEAPQASRACVRVDPKDLHEQFTKGSGAGGQHRNTTDSAVVLTHKPTGTRVRIESERSQAHNRRIALEVLQARLAEAAETQATAQQNQQRRRQVGSGMRGDKIRTVRVRDNTVRDHRTGKKMSYTKYRKGRFADLH